MSTISRAQEVAGTATVVPTEQRKARYLQT